MIESRRIWWGEACLVGKHENKMLLGKTLKYVEDNIKPGLKHVG
jgi:hypothetical protein